MTPVEMHDRAWHDMRRRVFACFATMPLGFVSGAILYDQMLKRGFGERDAWSAALMLGVGLLAASIVWLKLYRCPKCHAWWQPGSRATIPPPSSCRKCGFVLLYK